MRTHRLHRGDDLITQCHNWADFASVVGDSAHTKAQGDTFERLVQGYLATAPHWAMVTVWLWADVPASVKQRLGLGHVDRDEGFDLVAEQADGRLWAVQCKFRGSSDRPVVRADFDSTFALAATCRQLAGVILSHTSARPFQKLGLVAGARSVVELQLDTWATLSEEAWAAIRGWVSGEPITLTPRVPRPHQQAAIDAAVRHYVEAGSPRGRMVMPCGAGKSLTAFWIADALDARTVIVAVPSLALIRQTLLEWTRELSAIQEEASWLCVCSDESVVGGRSREDVEQDSFATSPAAAGIQATTNPDVIAGFLASSSGSRRILFTTYHSAPVLAEVIGQQGVAVDLAVLDEAHKTVGAVGKQFGTLLQEARIHVSRRLSMTATERVVRGRGIGHVLSMDDLDTYGGLFYEQTFKEAIHQEVISDYSVLTVCISETQVAEWVRDHRLIELESGTVGGARDLAAAIALSMHFKQNQASRAISFHRSIVAARRFAALVGEIPELGVSTHHVSSRTPVAERFQSIQAFGREERVILTNARCLSEGVDLPSLDTVAFVDPRRSKVDIVQATGRALRRAIGKERGYVVIPVLVPDGSSLDGEALSSIFRDVIDVVTALATEDERVVDQLRLQSAFFAGEAMSAADTEGVLRWDSAVPGAVSAKFDAVRNAITLQLWRRVARLQRRPFEGARSYVQALGLKSAAEWVRYCGSGKKPLDIPASPEVAYRRQGWKSLGDWLGTGAVAPQDRVYRPFEEARRFARSLGLASNTEWREYRRTGSRPIDIPADPDKIYRDGGWVSWADWLGTGRVYPKHIKWWPFDEARAFARTHGFRNQTEYFAYCKSADAPLQLPHAPNLVYADKGWLSWGDWLGTAFVATQQRQYRSFHDARAFARSLQLADLVAWRAYCESGEMPDDIPRKPELVYRNKGWAGVRDWLGVPAKRRSFVEARTFARSLYLHSMREWLDYCDSGRKPEDIPRYPFSTYRSDWVSWPDWLGYERRKPSGGAESEEP